MAFMFLQVTTAYESYYTSLKALQMKLQYIGIMWCIPLFHFQEPKGESIMLGKKPVLQREGCVGGEREREIIDSVHYPL